MVGEISLKPIGIVRNEFKESPSGQRDWWSGAVSEIVIDGSLTEALDGLEQFSHIIVLFWLHRITESEMPLKIHPMRRPELPLTGLFATRTPLRPNRIGVTIVKVLERKGNVLKVKGLDALDGSPVLDIKPYIPKADLISDARVPKWNQSISLTLQYIYRRLMDSYGPQHWWPADEPFEVMVGAVLTQSAAWVNVEKAINNLKAAQALSPRALHRLSLNELATLIRPCGYFNAKARKLKALAEWLGQAYSDDPAKLSATSLKRLRPQLLAVHGIGEETADSVILYAANKPIFVIDAYTRRIIDRLGLAPSDNSYSSYQTLFMENLPHQTALFNEYHALLVEHGKKVCRKRPLCRECGLKDICRYGQDTLK